MTTFDILLQLFTEYGYQSVFAVLLAYGFGVPLPEDVTLVAGGVIAGLGYANEHSMVPVGLLGVLLGDSVTFWLGRRYGERLTRLLILGRALTPERRAD